jgi:SAM-dependent methyltransferase
LGLFLLALDPASWDRYGLEPMPEPRAEAGRGLGLDRVFAGELESQALAGERFDVITFWDVLEHLPDPRGALEAAGRLLRPGGVVLLSLPNFSSYQARHFREDWYALRFPGHLHHFTPATLGRLLEAAGLRLRTLDDRFHRENYHHLKHSLLARLTRRYGPAGRLPYYFLKPLFHPWERLSTWWGGGSHLLVAAEPASGPRA